jgi:hypothetical protein
MGKKILIHETSRISDQPAANKGAPQVEHNFYRIQPALVVYLETYPATDPSPNTGLNCLTHTADLAV